MYDLEKPDLNELSHYGVLGMKWGKRKQTTDTRKDAFVIKKGGEIHRAITGKSDRQQTHMYATFKVKDAKGYAKRTKLFNGAAYDMTMKAKEDLISPSKKERVSTFVNLMLNDKKFAKTYMDAKNANSPIIRNKSDEDKFKGNIKKIEKEYTQFSAALGGNEQLRSKYFNDLKKKGYNMIIDDADAAIISNSPIVIFDRGKSLEVVSISPVTREYIKELKTKTDASVIGR